MANISKIKLPNNDTAYDIKDTVSGYTTNTGTVTSVRVQATSPVQSSVSTAQSASLNTTISLANGYGDTKNPYASKTKNYVLAAPSTANGVPTFRALTAADIPDLSSIYLTSYTETDPTVPSWAKASTKPSYTASEVGALPSATVIPSKTSDLTNDSGFITSYTDEKVKIETLPTGDNTSRSLMIKSSNTTPSTETAYSLSEYQARVDNDASILFIGNQKRGEIRLGYKSGSSIIYTYLKTSHTTSRTITLPNKTGTVALTSDIPSIPTTAASATTGISISDHSTTTITGVQSSTTTASKVTIGSSSTDYGVTAAGSGSASLTFTMDTTDTKKLKISFSHTHTAPTLGSKVPTVSASDVTVPIKNTSATTVVNGKSHTITDSGHTHTLS